jgi:hypothetical protein
MSKALGILGRVLLVAVPFAVYYLFVRIAAYFLAVDDWNHGQDMALFEEQLGLTNPSFVSMPHPTFLSADPSLFAWFLGVAAPVVAVGLGYLSVETVHGIRFLIRFITHGSGSSEQTQQGAAILEVEADEILWCHNAICQCTYHDNEWFDGWRNEWVNEDDFSTKAQATESHNVWGFRMNFEKIFAP